MNLKQKEYNVTIELESGLHIGGGDTSIEIGGIDNKVIRDSVSNEPYIPGSSLKGKIRHLLEDYYKGKKKNESLIKLIFGVGGNDKTDESFKQTRIQFVDLFMTKDTKIILDKSLGNKVYTAVKYENQIDRRSGQANHPRPTERVPKGSVFSGKLILNIYDEFNDNESDFEDLVQQGIKLLNKSYLGGSGSRGYGKVHATIKEIN